MLRAAKKVLFFLFYLNSIFNFLGAKLHESSAHRAGPHLIFYKINSTFDKIFNLKKEIQVRIKNLKCRVTVEEYNKIIEKVKKVREKNSVINISDYIRNVLLKSSVIYVEDKTTKNYEKRKELLKNYMIMKSDLNRLGNLASMVNVNASDVRKILQEYVKKLEKIISEF